MLVILYRESGYIPALAPGSELKMISVELRKWVSEDACDVVLAETVQIGDSDRGNVQRRARWYYGHAHDDAELQRAAIARFDELVAEHSQ